VKKIIFVGLILLMGMVLMACGSDVSQSGHSQNTVAERESNVQDNENATHKKEVKVAVSAPDGWEAVNSVGFLAHYSKDGASFMVKQEPYSGKTLDEVVQKAREIFEDSFDNVEYAGEAESITVDGKEAKKLIFTCEVSGLQMYYQHVFFFIGSDVYVITMKSSAENYELFTADFEQLLSGISFE
jgi:hypothetical protein